MKLSAEFQNGTCRLLITTEDEWEQKLLGAVAKGGDKLDALVEYKSEGHFTNYKCAAVHVLLDAGRKE